MIRFLAPTLVLFLLVSVGCAPKASPAARGGLIPDLAAIRGVWDGTTRFQGVIHTRLIVGDRATLIVDQQTHYDLRPVPAPVGVGDRVYAFAATSTNLPQPQTAKVTVSHAPEMNSLRFSADFGGDLNLVSDLFRAERFDDWARGPQPEFLVRRPPLLYTDWRSRPADDGRTRDPATRLDETLKALRKLNFSLVHEQELTVRPGSQPLFVGVRHPLTRALYLVSCDGDDASHLVVQVAGNVGKIRPTSIPFDYPTFTIDGSIHSAGKTAVDTLLLNTHEADPARAAAFEQRRPTVRVRVMQLNEGFDSRMR